MKYALILSLILPMAFANRENKAPVSSSSNAASAGQSNMGGVSNGPLGPNEEEREEVSEKASSMGGAPNAGGGMGTGTGAGSSVGGKLKGASQNAGAQGGED